MGTMQPDPGRPTVVERAEIALWARRGGVRPFTVEEAREFNSWESEARVTAAWPWLQDRRREGFEHTRRLNENWESDILDGHDQNPYFSEEDETGEIAKPDAWDFPAPDGWLTIRSIAVRADEDRPGSCLCARCLDDYAEPAAPLCRMCEYERQRDATWKR